jgi:hypothetical protein
VGARENQGCRKSSKAQNQADAGKSDNTDEAETGCVSDSTQQNEICARSQAIPDEVDATK